MNWFGGWFREQLNLPVNKLVGLVPTGKYSVTQVIGSDRRVVDECSRYRRVAVYYFSDRESFAPFKRGVVELHTENEAYSAGNLRLFYVNVMDGSPVGFRDTANVVFAPETLHELMDARDIGGLARSVLGSGMSIVGMVFAGVLGGAVAWIAKDYVVGAAKLVMLLVG